MAYVITGFNDVAEHMLNGVKAYTAQVDLQAGLSEINWMPAGSKATDNGGVVYYKDPSTKNWVLPALTPILILTQPADVSTQAGAVTGSVSVVAYAQDSTASYTPTYQWYSNTTEAIEGASAVSGATSATMALSAELTEGTYYYFCTITANVKTLNSAIATVTVAAAK